MELILGLLLLLFAFWLFGELILMLLGRFAVFLVCAWASWSCMAYLSQWLLSSGWPRDPRLAEFVAFLIVFTLGWQLLRFLAYRIRSVSIGDTEAVALDSLRVGIVFAIGLSVLVMLASLTRGELLFVSWFWLTFFAIAIAGLDVWRPSTLGTVANWLS
jgi:hypothetical protein